MNILFVTPFFPPQTGGVATYLEDIRRSLSDRGHHVVVLRSGDSDKITPCPHNNSGLVYQFYMRPAWFPATPMKGLAATSYFFFPTLWRLGRFLADHKIEIVCLEYPLPNVFYFQLLRFWKRFKLLVGIHGDDVLSLHLLRESEQQIVRRCIRRNDWLLAHSSSLLSQTEKIVGGLTANRSYLPIGVDTEGLRAMARNGQIHHALPREPFVLTVAKLYERKGVDILLQALHQIKSNVNGCRFVIAGDGPEEARLKQMSVDLKVDDMVLFLGEVLGEDIPGLISQCEFFLLPSRSEPFGIVLLEAMTFGKAIVATNVGGIPEFVTTGHNGVLVPSCDVGALASEIEHMLADKELRSRLGACGLRLVEQQYDYRNLVVRYEQLFEKVLMSGRT